MLESWLLFHWLNQQAVRWGKISLCSFCTLQNFRWPTHCLHTSSDPQLGFWMQLIGLKSKSVWVPATISNLCVLSQFDSLLHWRRIRIHVQLVGISHVGQSKTKYNYSLHIVTLLKCQDSFFLLLFFYPVWSKNVIKWTKFMIFFFFCFSFCFSSEMIDFFFSLCWLWPHLLLPVAKTWEAWGVMFVGVA